MSSSNRAIAPCEAVVQRNAEPAGPMRLPRKNSLSFIDEFNRRYQSAGLSIQPVELEEADDYDNPVNGPSPQ